eukprot:TRINITY_DN1358_c0_g1_i1.p1 TRINITY_DN1358_c0_g1~~TRINITY_DN1358_c0_g1_i1.p1  ORF type:complete len:689 (+),score=207.53 TRINITY_DN1358_c0_g1_i1:310-2376(+)
MLHGWNLCENVQKLEAKAAQAGVPPPPVDPPPSKPARQPQLLPHQHPPPPFPHSHIGMGRNPRPIDQRLLRALKEQQGQLETVLRRKKELRKKLKEIRKGIDEAEEEQYWEEQMEKMNQLEEKIKESASSNAGEISAETRSDPILQKLIEQNMEWQQFMREYVGLDGRAHRPSERDPMPKRQHHVRFHHHGRSPHDRFETDDTRGEGEASSWKSSSQSDDVERDGTMDPESVKMGEGSALMHDHPSSRYSGGTPKRPQPHVLKRRESSFAHLELGPQDEVAKALQALDIPVDDFDDDDDDDDDDDVDNDGKGNTSLHARSRTSGSLSMDFDAEELKVSRFRSVVYAILFCFVLRDYWRSSLRQTSAEGDSEMKDYIDVYRKLCTRMIRNSSKSPILSVLQEPKQELNVCENQPKMRVFKMGFGKLKQKDIDLRLMKIKVRVKGLIGSIRAAMTPRMDTLSEDDIRSQNALYRFLFDVVCEGTFIPDGFFFLHERDEILFDDRKRIRVISDLGRRLVISNFIVCRCLIEDVLLSTKRSATKKIFLNFQILSTALYLCYCASFDGDVREESVIKQLIPQEQIDHLRAQLGTWVGEMGAVIREDMAVIIEQVRKVEKDETKTKHMRRAFFDMVKRFRNLLREYERRKEDRERRKARIQAQVNKLMGIDGGQGGKMGEEEDDDEEEEEEDVL